MIVVDCAIMIVCCNITSEYKNATNRYKGGVIFMDAFKILKSYKYILIWNETINEEETYLFNMMFKEIYFIYKTPFLIWNGFRA